MEDMISVIVPIYNSERYLERCIESLLKQTYNNMEIVLVNDGSTDSSYEICKKYAKENEEHILLLNKCNGGLGSARNYGLDYCHGTYIGFVDSDDWVDNDYYKILYEAILKADADVASFGMDVTKCEHKDYKKTNYCFVQISGSEVLHQFVKRAYKDSNEYSVCTCLFKTKIIGGDRFVEGRINEDMDFKFNYMNKAKGWTFSDAPKYHYFQQGDSLSSGMIKARDFDLILQAKKVSNLCKISGNPETRKIGEMGVKKAYFSILARLAFYGCKDDVNEQDSVEMCLREVRKDYWALAVSPMKFSRKVLMTLLCISFEGTKRLGSIIKV